MFKILIACVAAVMLGSAQAGFVSGKCPNITSIPYRAEFANRALKRALYADDTTFSYIKLLNKAVGASQGLNMTCLNDGTYGFSASQYAYWFQNSTGTLAMNFLFHDAPTGTQLTYMCIDQRKLRDLLKYVATESGLALPSAVVNSISKLVAAGRFDVFVVTSAQTSISTAVQNAMVASATPYFPKFSMKALTAFNQTGC